MQSASELAVLWSSEHKKPVAHSKSEQQLLAKCHLNDSGVLLDSLSIHIVLSLFLIELSLFLGSCVLVLLVLRHEIVHI